MPLLLKQLQYRNIIAVILMPLLGIFLAFRTPLKKETAIWTISYYFLTGVGITAGSHSSYSSFSHIPNRLPGYHRLWSHQSYKAGSPLQLYLATAGAACFQGSILEWCRNHRTHHRYVDTDLDPHSIEKGVWHSHMGWLLTRPSNPPPKVNVSDLSSNRIVKWQDNHFALIAISFGLFLPALVAGYFWGDWKGGIVYAGILRIFFFQQATFCVNSLAHWLGEQKYDDKHSPRDHLFTALVTFGEGYHNFHHEFPGDYRNGILWHQYDPSKWFIYTWEQMGLARDLGRYEGNVVQKGVYQQEVKKLEKVRESLDWGTPVEDLQRMSWEEFDGAVNGDGGRKLIAIEGFVYDVETFVDVHPGGRTVMSVFFGKDATAAFNGGVYARMSSKPVC
jgi:stearoyl-CoA desaturase (delta-9 desaturase)